MVASTWKDDGNAGTNHIQVPGTCMVGEYLLRRLVYLLGTLSLQQEASTKGGMVAEEQVPRAWPGSKVEPG